MAFSFLRFLAHTQRRITVGRTPLDEWSARRRDLYLATHNSHNRQTSMSPVGFEPTISASERPQTYALDRAATGTGFCMTGSEVKLRGKTLRLYFVPTCPVFLTTLNTVLFHALRLSACNELSLLHKSHLTSVRHFLCIFSTTVVHRVDCNHVIRKVTVEWVAFILHTRKVSGSNRNFEKGYVA